MKVTGERRRNACSGGNEDGHVVLEEGQSFDGIQNEVCRSPCQRRDACHERIQLVVVSKLFAGAEEGEPGPDG